MKLTPEEVRGVAEAYAGQVFLTIDLKIGETELSDDAAALIFRVVHDQIVEAWIAGFVAGSGGDGKEAA